MAQLPQHKRFSPRVFDRHGKVVSSDFAYTGDEPDFTGWGEWDVNKFMGIRERIFNFYNYYLTNKDLLDDVCKWMTAHGYSKEDIKTVKDEDDRSLNSAMCKLCRAMNRGMPPTHAHAREYFESNPGLKQRSYNDEEYVRGEIAKILSRAASVEKTEKKKKLEAPTAEGLEADISEKLSPAERGIIRARDKVIPQLEWMMDDKHWGDEDTRVETVNVYAHLKENNIPLPALDIVYSWVDRCLAVYQALLDGTDEQLSEAYSFLKKPGIRNRIHALGDIRADIDKYRGAHTKYKAPKVKKSKVKSPEVQVRRLKYKESDTDLGLTSIHPAKIPGARKMVLYNAKQRRLLVLDTSIVTPFAVKGQAVLNFTPETSWGITLRKPKETLAELMTHKNEKASDKFIASIKGKKKLVNGRFNSDTIILKVYANLA